MTAEPLLTEIERTLAKPYFARALSLALAHRYLDLVRQEGIVVPLTVPASGIATHAEDDVIFAAALSGAARFVVSSDHRLLRLGEYRNLIIVSAAQFLAMLPGLLEAEESSS